MPQFDKITFFNQLFWVFLFFFSFYFTFLIIVLPTISTLLKARSKKLQKNSSGLVSFSKEKEIITHLTSLSLENSSLNIKNTIFNSIGTLKMSINDNVKKTNIKNLNSNNNNIGKQAFSYVVGLGLVNSWVYSNLD